MSVFESTIKLIALPDCIGCGLEGANLCQSCLAAEILPFGERCYGCGAISPRSRTCQRCRRGGAPRYVWVATDYAGLAKDLTRIYKFGHRRMAAYELAQAMVETLKTYNAETDLVKANYLVIGIPTATSRVRERGFDHAELLAKYVAKRLGQKTYSGMTRLGQSRQVGAKRHTRLTQKDHAYYVRHPEKVAGRNILLIDDVVTTGATLRTAAKALRAAGARHVDALVFAKRI